jgi:hypothetical protein
LFGRHQVSVPLQNFGEKRKATKNPLLSCLLSMSKHDVANNQNKAFISSSSSSSGSSEPSWRAQQYIASSISLFLVSESTSHFLKRQF